MKIDVWDELFNSRAQLGPNPCCGRVPCYSSARSNGWGTCTKCASKFRMRRRTPQ